MKRYGLIAAISLLVAVNALVLANVAHNRSGEYDAEMKLTERELPIHYSWRSSDKENTGLSLRLSWGVYDPGMTTKEGRYRRRHISWFDQAKLESIGFDCSRPITSENADQYYGKMLPRKTFAVLEYEGKTWQEWQDDQAQQIREMEEQVKKGAETKKDLDVFKKEYKRSLMTKSRLFVVDVGNDASLLRQKYSERSRYIITPAKVRLSYQYKNNDSVPPSIERLEGEISEILIDEINVPLAKRKVLDQLLNAEKGKELNLGSYQYYYDRQQPPDYTVTLRYGKRYEPWIVDIQKIAKQETMSSEKNFKKPEHKSVQ
jgi:hypothetical protein